MRRKLSVILLSLIAVLLLLYLLLPYIIEESVNKVLADMEEYQGQVEDVSLQLFRGKYVIRDLKMVQQKGEIPLPFIAIPEIALSLDWGSLFRGVVVAAVYLKEPTINFIIDEIPEPEPVEPEKDLVEQMKDLMPMRINVFEILQGRINFIALHTDPRIDLPMENLNLRLANISNITDQEDPLPSSITMDAVFIGGFIDISGQFNALREIPDLSLNIKVENINLVQLNDLLREYGNLELQDGRYSLYSEVVISDGYLTGYAKPVIEDLDIREGGVENGVFQRVWERVAGSVTDVAEHQPQDKIATRIPLEGQVENPEAGVWRSIINLLRNAFVEPIPKQLDHALRHPKINDS